MIERNESGDVYEAQSIREHVGRKRIGELTIRSNGPGLLFIAAHIALILSTGYLLFLSLGTWWCVPASFIHGIGIVHLFAPFHECMHRTAFRSQWLTRTVAFSIGLVLTLLPRSFRYEHADHHTHTQMDGLDPQAIPMGETLGG